MVNNKLNVISELYHQDQNNLTEYFNNNADYQKSINFKDYDILRDAQKRLHLIKEEVELVLSEFVLTQFQDLLKETNFDNLKEFQKIGIITPKITYVNFDKIANSNQQLNEKYLRFNDRILQDQESDNAVLLWDKNVMFFPRKINNEFYFLHRIKPDIQLAHVPSIAHLTEAFWTNYLTHFQSQIILTSKYDHEVSYIGGGSPPIETAIGWLIIYHGVKDTIDGYVYAACAALLDLNNPYKEISRLPYPLFEPDQPWELHGEVINVCFPTGTAQFDDTLYIYYGAADESIACASLNLPELLNELKRYEK